MLNTLSHLPHRRLQCALAASGLIAGVAALVTCVSIVTAFMLAGVHYYRQPLAMFMPHLHIVPSTTTYGALDGVAWLLWLTLYAGLLVGIPAFCVLYFGKVDAD